MDYHRSNRMNYGLFSYGSFNTKPQKNKIKKNVIIYIRLGGPCRQRKKYSGKIVIRVNKDM